MTIPFWCVFLAILFPVAVKGIVSVGMKKLGGYDNNNPRGQQAKLTGWAARAQAAQLNSFEALGVFAPCVFINHLTQAPVQISALLSVAYIASRVIYVALYIGDLPSLRSLVWFTGFTISLVLATITIFM
jgi:uncharacterized MAPEG superfamily protein